MPDDKALVMRYTEIATLFAQSFTEDVMKWFPAACLATAKGSLPAVRTSLRPCLLIFFFALSACSQSPYSITLMPAPAVLADAERLTVAQNGKIREAHPGILYATFRPPAEDLRYPYYLNERGDVIRLGRARIEVLEEDVSPEEIQAQSVSAKREAELTLSVRTVEEYGLSEASLSPFSSPDYQTLGTTYADKRFAEAVNADLARSENKDVVIYVHGYKVPFPDPVLVAAELWHFLGYRGAFIAYSWPATPNFWAYLNDLETAAMSAHGLRELLNYLSSSTEVDRIHILGYSAGTRVVIEALHQIALLERQGNAQKTRLGKVALVGSDMDRQLFGMKLDDGVVDRLDGLTIYISEDDMALMFLRWLGFRARAGQMWAEGTMSPQVRDYLLEQTSLALVNVTNAAGATLDNGHGYFRASPWVSSDILATLLYDLAPAERGLYRVDSDAVWRFPEDYPARVRVAVTGAETTSGLAQ